MPLELKTRSLSDVTVVECTGRVVFGDEATYLRSAVKELLSKNPRVVLDFEKVRDVDSGGVGLLLGLLTSSVSAGGGLKLARINDKVRNTLSVTRLLGILTAYDTVEKAVAAFRRSEPAQGSHA